MLTRFLWTMEPPSSSITCSVVAAPTLFILAFDSRSHPLVGTCHSIVNLPLDEKILWYLIIHQVAGLWPEKSGTFKNNSMVLAYPLSCWVGGLRNLVPLHVN